MHSDKRLRVSRSILACRIEETGEAMPGNKMYLPHVLLVLLRLSYAGQPDLSQLARMLRCDVTAQFHRHLLRQLVDLLKVVGQPVGFRVQIEEHARGVVLETETIAGRTCTCPLFHVDHAELAWPGRFIEIACYSVAGVIRVEL